MSAPTVAIIPWGDVIEDYLAPLGMTLDDLASRVDEGWLFGYVEALGRAGIRSVVVASSAEPRPRRLVHEPTGTPILALPRPRPAAVLRTTLGDPGGRGWEGGPMRRTATAVSAAASLGPRSLQRVVADEGVVAVLVQEYESPRYDRLVRWGRRQRVPVIGVYQGGDLAPAPGEARLRATTLRHAPALVSPSAREIERLRQRYAVPPHRVHHVVNPVDLAAWPMTDPAQARSRRGLSPDGLVVLCHGRIDVHRKGLDVLIDAWRRHRTDRRDRAVLVIVGGGDGEAALERLVSDTPDVRWERGHRDRSEIRAWLAAADVYVSASRTEGQSVATLEAMASGLEVVATATAGTDEIADAPGVTRVPVGDVEALVGAFDRIAADPDGSGGRGRANRAFVARHFDVDVVGDRLRRVIERAIAELRC